MRNSFFFSVLVTFFLLMSCSADDMDEPGQDGESSLSGTTIAKPTAGFKFPSSGCVLGICGSLTSLVELNVDSGKDELGIFDKESSELIIKEDGEYTITSTFAVSILFSIDPLSFFSPSGTFMSFSIKNNDRSLQRGELKMPAIGGLFMEVASDPVVYEGKLKKGDKLSLEIGIALPFVKNNLLSASVWSIADETSLKIEKK